MTDGLNREAWKPDPAEEARDALIERLADAEFADLGPGALYALHYDAIEFIRDCNCRGASHGERGDA